jgi:hypothetical protein
MAFFFLAAAIAFLSSRKRTGESSMLPTALIKANFSCLSITPSRSSPSSSGCSFTTAVALLLLASAPSPQELSFLSVLLLQSRQASLLLLYHTVRMLLNAKLLCLSLFAASSIRDPLSQSKPKYGRLQEEILFIPGTRFTRGGGTNTKVGSR